MKILLINHYSGSPKLGMEYRPYYLSRNWVRQGHQVTVAASSFSHLRRRNPMISSRTFEEMVDGIRYFWIRGPSYHGNGLGRVRNMVSFVLGLFLHARRIGRADLVIASSTYPLDIIPAWWVAHRSGARLVFEVHDLWPLSPMELGGMSRWHPFILVMQCAENFAYRVSDKVVSLLPKADRHMIEHGMSPEKFVYLPNGICLDEWAAASEEVPSELHETLLARKALGEFLVGYAGAHGIANALTTLIDAAARLRNQSVCIVLIGEGPEKANLERLASDLGLVNIIFSAAVSKKAIPAVLAMFDVLYIASTRSPIYRFGISPNKLMDYMMAAKPIICAIEAGNDPVAEADCGLSIAPEDGQLLADAILSLRSLTVDQREKMGLRGRAYVTQHHDYSVLAADFIDNVL